MLRKANRYLFLLELVMLVAVFLGVLLHSERSEAYNNTIPISALKGMWIARDGSGKGTIDGIAYVLKLRRGSINVEDINLDPDGRGGYCDMSCDYQWDIFDSKGKKIAELPYSYSDSLYYQNTGDNQYTYEYEYGGDKLEITILSENSCVVLETLTDVNIYGYSCSGTLKYYVDKKGTEGNTSSSGGGGCDVGIGFGLIIALGALAVLRMAKRKA